MYTFLARKWRTSNKITELDKLEEDIKADIKQDNLHFHMVENDLHLAQPDKTSTTPVFNLLEQQENVEMVPGRLFTIDGWGERIGHAQITENRDIKNLKSDYFVTCSSFFLNQIMMEIHIYAPILRLSTTILKQRLLPKELDSLRFLNSETSYLSLDNLPLAGPSTRFANLYYFTGF